MPARDTAMASSNNLAGRILGDLRLLNRSMTSANITMEQATRGKMGQPAACMIESKRSSGRGFWCLWSLSVCGNYG
jgi:hypothetical protein